MEAFCILDALNAALLAAAEGWEGFEPELRLADPRFGDFQANGVLPFAKKLGKNPRALATQLLQQAQEALRGLGIEGELSGPGFLNFTLQPELLERWLTAYASAEAFVAGAATLYPGRTIVVDYSSPNTAKEMHVGHIRSTVIGESLARLLRLCGAKVITDNHIGDWGTQFGILILEIKRQHWDLDAPHPDPLAALETLYRDGQARVKEDPQAAAQARQELVLLQQGDPQNFKIWTQVKQISYAAFEAIYRRLDVHFDHVLGESFYRDKVDAVYEQLQSLGIAQESEGALVVFHPEHPRFAKTPFMIRKSDGASNYASTDLATLCYRTKILGAQEILYVVDVRQQDHFEQLFLTANKWFNSMGKTLPVLCHIGFGTILGADGKAIKTRSGGTVKLKALLDEAEQRAYAAVTQKNPQLSEEDRRHIARVVGVGAVRYADLSQNRSSDYIFDWDKLLAFEGNTAPYLLYAVARLHGILRHAPLESPSAAAPLETPHELALAKKLLNSVTALKQSLMELRPHFLCQYLYELSGTFNAFYAVDKVLTSDPPTQAKRVALCRQTLNTLTLGLETLGMETLLQM